MKKVMIVGVVASVGLSAMAGGWNVSAGPAWRARVEGKISGGAERRAASVTGGYDRDVANKHDWTAADVAPGNVVEVQDPDYPTMPGLTKWAAVAHYTETAYMPNAGSSFGGRDDDSPLGVRLNLGYDFDVSERFSVGAQLRFAGYWGMDVSRGGATAGGVQTVTGWTDYFLFSGGPVPSDTDFAGFDTDATPHVPYRENYSSVQTAVLGEVVRARLRSDLYQIGLGPKCTCHAFKWLDAYAGVSALCNLARLDLDSSDGSAAETLCRFGLGAELGVAAFLTDNVGLYAEVGYEWIDEAETSVGAFDAEVDYSGLVVSTGLVMQF